MGIDQAKLGQHIQEQMAAIEGDSAVPDHAEIGAIVTIVEITAPGEQPAEQLRNLRTRSNVPPHIAIGLLEEAKMMQLAMLQGG